MRLLWHLPLLCAPSLRRKDGLPPTHLPTYLLLARTYRTQFPAGRIFLKFDTGRWWLLKSVATLEVRLKIGKESNRHLT